MPGLLANKKPEGVRISTIGVCDPQTGEEKMFFPLDSIREMRYIYAVSETVLREDGGLHKKIVTQIKGKATEDVKDISFAVYSTKYKSDYGYLLAYSPIIQK